MSRRLTKGYENISPSLYPSHQGRESSLPLVGEGLGEEYFRANTIALLSKLYRRIAMRLYPCSGCKPEPAKRKLSLRGVYPKQSHPPEIASLRSQ